MRKTISQLSMLSPSEYNQIVNGFNDTAVDYPKDKCVHTIFEEQVAKEPNKVAVIACDKPLTYKELNEQANRIAHSLLEKGVQPNDIIAFMLPRKSYLLSVMFGILKSGAAYMPIDPDYPEDRIDYMLKDSRAKICITENNIAELLGNDDKSNPNVEMSSKNLCYCIYTSGSTGNPKGVLIKHNNIVNLILDSETNKFNKTNYNVALLTTVTFDVATQEVLTALLNGKCSYLFPSKNTLSIAEVINTIVENNIDILFATPSYFDALTQNGNETNILLSNLKYVVLAGEVFFLNNTVFNSPNFSNVKFINQYGPAETHVVTASELKKNDIRKNNIILSQIEVISKAELKTVTKDFNNTDVDYPKDKCVHTLFEEQVVKKPNKVAVIACDRTLTYCELNEQANRIAHSLIAKGVKHNDIIAFMLPRKSYLLSVMFGILKSGAAYMPIDPDYPEDRIEYMLKDSGAKLCITEDNVAELLKNEDMSNPNISMSSDNYYCALHTSGSTGKPKMSVLKHSNLQNFINGNKQFFENVEISVSATIITFDAFILDTVVPLCQGIPLKLLCNDEIYNHALFEEAFGNVQNAMFFSTPTKLKHYIENSKTKAFTKNIASFIVGGELFTTELRDLIRKYNTNANVFNIYGPTEDTICISYEKVK